MFIVLAVSSMITAVVVAYVGIIGFIGMIVPQLLRRFYWQYELGTQMVLNLIVGSTVMVVADFIGNDDTTSSNTCKYYYGIIRRSSFILYSFYTN